METFILQKRYLGILFLFLYVLTDSINQHNLETEFLNSSYIRVKKRLKKLVMAMWSI